MQSTDTVSTSRVLVLAGVEGDTRISMHVLRDAHLTAKACSSMEELEVEVGTGVGIILIAEEVLIPDGIAPLKQCLSEQPTWSEIPVIVMTYGGFLQDSSRKLCRMVESIRNVTFLDRPVRLATFVSVLRSALAARKRQYEIRDLLEEYKVAADAAQAANRAKSAFLANMSHEIRTPLSSIIGFSELLIHGQTNDRDRIEFVGAIQRNGHHLTQIVEDILDLAKIESGKMSVERVPASLPTIVSEVIGMMRMQAHKKNVAINFEVEEGVPKMITTDPTRLKQILINIVGNAVKFTEKGRIDILMCVAPNSTSYHKKLDIIVKDTGRGISREHQDNLFQAFSQADVSTTRKFGGTGLGLILSRRLAEALGGGVELTSSEFGVGSTFTVTIEAIDWEGTFGAVPRSY